MNHMPEQIVEHILYQVMKYPVVIADAAGLDVLKARMGGEEE